MTNLKWPKGHDTTLDGEHELANDIKNGELPLSFHQKQNFIQKCNKVGVDIKEIMFNLNFLYRDKQ